MGACKSCSRVVLVLINILFSLIGLTFLVVGCIVRWGTDIMNQALADAYKDLQNATGQDLGNFDIADLLEDVTLSFIIIGAVFFVIGILGCIGACCTVRPMLILYIIILSLIIVVEITFVVLLFAAQSKVDEWLKTPFKSTIEEYEGINGTDAVSLGLNLIMSKFDCCGVEGYGDFNASTRWNRTFANGTKKKAIPAICCKDTKDEFCWEAPSSNNSNKDQGCYDALKDWLKDNMAPLIGASAGILAVEVILVIFACVACVRDRKTDDEDDDDSYNQAVLDDKRSSYDAIRAYDNHGYRGPHHNRPYNGSEPYRGYDDRGPRDYQGRRDRRY